LPDVKDHNGIPAKYLMRVTRMQDLNNADYADQNKTQQTVYDTEIIINNADETNFTGTISELEAHVNYNVKVRLQNANQPDTWSKWSKEVKILTYDSVPEGEPLELESDPDTYTSSSGQVKWKLPTYHLRNGVIIAHRVKWWRKTEEYTENGGGVNTRGATECTESDKCEIEVEVLDYTIDGLDPYTEYYVTVESRTNFDSLGTADKEKWGPASPVHRFRTGSTFPERPPQPSIRNLKNTVRDPTKPNGDEDFNATLSANVEVSWTELSTRYGPPTKIQIIVEYDRVGDNCSNGRTDDGYELGTDCGGACEKRCDETSITRLQPLPMRNWYVAFERDLAPGDATDGNETISGLTPGQEFGYKKKAGTTHNEYGFRLVVYTTTTADDDLWAVSQALDEAIQMETLASTDEPPSSAGAVVGVMFVLMIGVVLVVFVRPRYLENEKQKSSGRAPDRGTGPTRSGSRNRPPQGTQQYSQEASMEDGDIYDNATDETDLSAAMAEGSDYGLGIQPPPQLPPVASNVIAVENLANAITQMAANSDLAFSEEYEGIETGSEFSRMAAQLMQNKTKNRYANILAYDYSRVRLSMKPGDQYSDYINANYMNGYGKTRERHYIAAQGPTPLTLPDFWRLLWESQVPVIAMVTNCEEKGRIKCARYWPQSINEPMSVSDTMTVTLEAQEDFPDYSIRTLVARFGSKSHKVIQFHFTTWPDHGVPEDGTATLAMLKKCNDARAKVPGPMLVHCSAGVGRTGTLIAIDINMDRAAAIGTVDVHATLNQMRRERSTMVQTEAQYIFIYESLLAVLSDDVQDIGVEELQRHVVDLRKSKTADGTIKLNAEFAGLNSGVKPTTRTDSAQMAVNVPKNRFKNVLPYESTRVKLQAIPGVTGSDYINASWIDGQTKRQAYVATQGPMDGTLADFWRMIWEHDIGVVVMLTQLKEDGREKSEQYWPDMDEPALDMNDFQVSAVSEQETSFGWERTIQVFNQVSEESRDVKQYQYTVWPDVGAGYGAAGDQMLKMYTSLHMYEDSTIVQPDANIYGNAAAMEDQVRASQLKPIAIHCSAGVGRTGAFISTLIGMEKLKQDRTINLPTIVRHVRTQRSTMVQTVDQYDFAYHVLATWAAHLQSGAPLRKLMGGGNSGGGAAGMSVPVRRQKPPPVADDGDSGPPVPTKARGASDGYLDMSGDDNEDIDLDAPPLPSKGSGGVQHAPYMEPSTQSRSSLRMSITNDDGEIHGQTEETLSPFVRKNSISLDDPMGMLEMATEDDDFEGLEL
jgi:protein tyrosine phosphatase